MDRLNNKPAAAIKPLDKTGPATPFQAILNMLQRDPADPGNVSKPRVNVARHTLDRISREISQGHMDADAIMQILSDLELVETVLVGSILSPKDLGDTDLTFTTDTTLFDSEISRLLMEPVEQYFKRDYRIDEQLDLMLRNILFRKGAHCFVTLPENVLDSLINGGRRVSMERFESVHRQYTAGQPMGFLGHPDPNKRHVSMENYNTAIDNSNYLQYGDFKSNTVTVTDNFHVLKAPKISDHMRTLRIANKLERFSASMENAAIATHRFTEAEINELYQRRPGSQQSQVVTAPEFMSRNSVGHPLALEWPMEALMPIFPAGQPHDHKAYMAIVDQNGYPVTKDTTRDFMGEMQLGWNKSKGGDANSELLRLTREAMGHGGTGTTSEFELNQLQETYANLIVNDFNNRMRNGMYDQDMEIALTQEVKEIMLYRNWKGKQTQLVFLPAELVTYVAFEYNERGVGQTLLAKSKMIATMRSTLLMADVVGGMRNAVGRKKVNITLDPDDVDPEKTVTDIQSQIMESAHRAFPLAAPDPTQALDYLVRSGYDFAINTNGADYAETKVEYDDYNTNVQAGNPELQDRLRRMHIASMGIPPEKVDPMSNPDFATSIIQNDLVMSRRVKEKQKIFCNHLTKFFRTFVKYSSILRDRMNVVIQNHKDMLPKEYEKASMKEVIDDFIEAIEVSLPAPDTTQYEKQAEAFEGFNRLLDLALEPYISSDLFPDDFMGIQGIADMGVKEVKAYFQRMYLADNNIMPQLNVLTEMDGKKPAFSLLDAAANRRETLGAAMLEWAGDLTKAKRVLAKRYASVLKAAEEGDAMGGDFDSGGSDGGDGGGFDGNFDDMGGSSDFGGSDMGGDDGGLMGDMNDDFSATGEPGADEGGGDPMADPMGAAQDDAEAGSQVPEEEEDEDNPNNAAPSKPQ